MTSESQSHIQKFLYNLSMENYAEADKDLNAIIKHKVDQRYNEALEKVKNEFAQGK